MYPELEMINSKLVAIEQVCNEFTGQKFVTEEVMAQFLACTLKKIMEMNGKQNEKIEKLKGYILGHHKCVKEEIRIFSNLINISLKRIENILEEKQVQRNILKRIINRIFLLS